jgi:excisionase family DNA binding protein
MTKVAARTSLRSSSPRFFSRAEIAEMFGVSLSTVTRWASQGLIRTIRTPGGHYRFPDEEVRRLVSQNRKRS